MLKILWKRGEIAPEEQFLLLSTIFCYLMLEFVLNRDQIFSSRYAVIRDNRSRDNEGRLYSQNQIWAILRISDTVFSKYPLIVWIHSVG